MLKKYIFNFIFEISNSEDNLYKEDLFELIYYKSLYLKNFFDINLIEMIFQSLINSNIDIINGKNFFILSLKIVYELITADLIEYNFLINKNFSKTIEKYCYFLSTFFNLLFIHIL